MNKTNFILCLLLYVFKVHSQNVITIEKVNELVFLNSNEIKIINNNYQQLNIEADFYNLSLLPKISSSINLPYQRSISEVIQSDGSQRFIERNFINSSFNLNISQVLPFTGGIVSVSSSVNGSRDFNNEISSFSSNWANISYQQTLNGSNSFKWNKKLNFLTIKKNSLNYIKERIKLKYELSKVYVETQLLQLKTNMIAENIKKTKNILFELEEKFKFGRTIKLEVEQTKMTLEQLNRQFEISNLEYLAGIQLLKREMGTDFDFELQAVEQNDFLIDKKELKAAIKSNGFDLDKTIQLLEIESNIEKVKKEGAITVNMQLGMGLNSTSNDLANLYDTPSQSQFLTIGAKIPILDWGMSKKKYAIVKLQKDNLEFEFLKNENKMEEQLDNLSNYKASLIFQIKSLKEQIVLSKNIEEMFTQLLKLGRKTITEYKNQLAESYNILVEHQKAVNDLYLLKLKINEFNLIF
ncbi:MAG: TolC family protein [Flavobacterium sp.]